MRLTDNKYITKAVAEILAKDGWTIKALATANPKKLTKYNGIGAVTAQRIVTESQRMTNKSAMEESSRDVTPEEAFVALRKNGWSVEALATTIPARISGYPVATAKRVIEMAREKVNTQTIDQPVVFVAPQPDEPPAVSVRVRRIREAYERGELT